MAGEYTGGVVRDGVKAFVRAVSAGRDRRRAALERRRGAARRRAERHRRPRASAPAVVLHRLSGAADLHRDEAGRARARAASRQLRHRLPPVLDPAAVQHRRDHDGLRPRRRGRGGVQRQSRTSARSRSIGDGGFWHNGLTSAIGNAVFNKSDNVTIIVDNGYTSATGGQDILSSYSRQRDPQDAELDREGRARRRRRMGAHARRTPTTSPACATPCARR